MKSNPTPSGMVKIGNEKQWFPANELAADIALNATRQQLIDIAAYLLGGVLEQAMSDGCSVHLALDTGRGRRRAVLETRPEETTQK